MVVVEGTTGQRHLDTAHRYRMARDSEDSTASEYTKDLQTELL